MPCATAQAFVVEDSPASNKIALEGACAYALAAPMNYSVCRGHVARHPACRAGGLLHSRCCWWWTERTRPGPIRSDLSKLANLDKVRPAHTQPCYGSNSSKPADLDEVLKGVCVCAACHDINNLTLAIHPIFSNLDEALRPSAIHPNAIFG